jgi:hypothetical protein
VTRQTTLTGRGHAHLSTKEKWGYGVWLFVGLVFGVPESWAGLASPPWPSLSNTVAHLEALWSPVAVIVVALTVIVVFQVVRYPPGAGGPGSGRTEGGRLTRRPGQASPVPAYLYFPLALAVVAAGSVIAAVASSDMFVLGYTIYGLLAVFCVIVPDLLAYWFARDVPFPTLARTVVNLERRWPPAAMIIVAGLVVLMFHLAFFPWPDKS